MLKHSLPSLLPPPLPPLGEVNQNPPLTAHAPPRYAQVEHSTAHSGQLPHQLLPGPVDGVHLPPPCSPVKWVPILHLFQV